MKTAFVTGGTGYIGSALIAALYERGWAVHALVRPGSAHKLPAGVIPVLGNALEAASFDFAIPPAATLVHLVGTPHPSPRKAAQFRSVDLASIRASSLAAQQAGVRHFVYVSVAHPAPIMQAYIAVRQEGEALLARSGIPATILRPWYVLGPGHRWPRLLTPLYFLCRQLPATRDSALRLGLVDLRAMLAALIYAVESPPPTGVRIVDVEGIRKAVQAHALAKD